MISSEKEIGTCVLTKMLIYSIIAHKFRYLFGSDINSILTGIFAAEDRVKNALTPLSFRQVQIRGNGFFRIVSPISSG